jgi:hypothetical protein
MSEQQPPKPAKIMKRDSYPRVKNAHIIPAVYQRNFADGQQVAVHFVDRDTCEIRNVKTAGTRRAYYRRTRPDGSEIDDIEASLSVLEGGMRPVFDEIRAGESLTLERKSVLAQFFGMQMARGPAFFSDRTELMSDIVNQLSVTDIQPKALEAAGDDVFVVRQQVLETQLSTTTQFVTMLSVGVKLAAVLGSMRWHLLRFDGPVLAYSDHPVVVWPADERLVEPFDRPRLGPLSAVEVRVPLAPDLAVLMTWSDIPDTPTPLTAAARFAGELNAFVVAQADLQWMHHPGAEPPVPPGFFGPMSRSFEVGYSALSLAKSQRRAFAAGFIERTRGSGPIGEFEIAHMNWST